MARGRKPKPDALKRAQGNPGKRALPELPVEAAQQPLAPPARSSAPARLSEEGRRIWDALAPELERMKFLRSSDQGAFERYCDTLASYWRVTLELREVGETYETESAHGRMLRVHPKFAVQDRLARRLDQLEDRFGLTPAARQQILQRLAAQPTHLPLQSGERPNEAGEALAPSRNKPSPIGILRGGGGALH